MNLKQVNAAEEIISSNASDNTDIFSKISQYRSELLGIALIMISIAHLQSNAIMMNTAHIAAFSESTLRVFNMAGSCGVKIFLFLAGFGAYFSLLRNPDDVKFYGRRAKRMFPYYYPMVFLCLLIYKPDITIIAGNLSLLGWWLSNTVLTRWQQYFWFHQDIYIIYVLTPIFFRVLNNCKNIALNMVVLWLLFLGIGLAFPPEIMVQGVQVIPVFITGMLLCKLNVEGFHINKLIEPIIYLLGFCSFSLLMMFYPRCGGVHYGYSPTTSEHLLIDLFTAAVFLFFLRTLVFVNGNENKLKHRLMQLLSLLGKRSLEIYLIQAFLIYQVLFLNNAQYFGYLYNFVKPAITAGHLGILEIMLGLVALCTILGILYGVLMDFVLDKTVSFYNNIKFKLLTLYKTNS